MNNIKWSPVHNAQCDGCYDMPPRNPLGNKEYLILAVGHAAVRQCLAVSPFGATFPHLLSSWDNAHSMTNHGHKALDPLSQLGHL